jgi:energy-coupling factor transport system ATP-binding protein
MALNGLVPHATGGVFRGNVSVRGKSTVEHSVATLAPLVGMVFQDPEVQLLHTRVEDEIVFGPENLGIPPAEIATRLEWALRVTGLTAYRDRSPLLLSGGEKQRVAIAAALAMQPGVLVLDEPTASLDPAGKAAIFGVLADLTRTLGMTVVMATQETERAFRYADRILVLSDGVISLDGTPSELLERAQVLSEMGLALPEMTELRQRMSAVMGRPYRFTSAGAAYRELRQEVANDVGALSSEPPQPLDLEVPRLMDAAPQVRIEGLHYRYDVEREALRGIDLTLQSGDYVALVGRNGSGKTTLARHLNGLLRPTEGRVALNGRDIRTQRTAALASQVGYVFQNPDHQIFAPTVKDEIAFGLRAQRAPADLVDRRVDEAMALFDLTPYRDEPPASLGHGQRRLVALASILVTQPEILILDEPTDGLDARSQREIMDAVGRFNEEGGTVLLITHDVQLVASHASRVVALSAGQVIFDGQPAGLFSDRGRMTEAGLAPPRVTRLAERLAVVGMPNGVITADHFARAWSERGRMAVAAHDSGDDGLAFPPKP